MAGNKTFDDLEKLGDSITVQDVLQSMFGYVLEGRTPNAGQVQVVMERITFSRWEVRIMEALVHVGFNNSTSQGCPATAECYLNIRKYLCQKYSLRW